MGIELGDGHAAHNLAIDLVSAGRVEEATVALAKAVELGDTDAQEMLNDLQSDPQDT